jgi:hypothetical protein
VCLDADASEPEPNNLQAVGGEDPPAAGEATPPPA